MLLQWKRKKAEMLREKVKAYAEKLRAFIDGESNDFPTKQEIIEGENARMELNGRNERQAEIIAIIKAWAEEKVTCIANYLFDDDI
jgi:hypothetical protein